MSLWRERIILTILLGMALFLNVLGNRFQLGYHIDEPKKVWFILHGIQDFLHPILMLQMVRLANFVFDLKDEYSLAILGRTIVGLNGVLLVFFSYALTRRSHSARIALIVASTVAISPIVCLHAHYLKEDVTLTTWLIGSILALLRFLEKGTTWSAIWLGVACGFAFSSHYKSALLIPLFVLFVSNELVVGSSILSLILRNVRNAVLLGMIVAITCTLTWMMVNFPAFDHWDTFTSGVLFEGNHAVSGHAGVRINPIDHGFAYHLSRSLFPGMTFGIATFAMIGIAFVFVRWRRVASDSRLIWIFTVLFYLIPEMSPTKPPPDDMRYVLPSAVGLVCLLAELLQWIESWTDNFRRLVVFSLFFIAWSISAIDSLQIDFHLERETRDLCPRRFTSEAVETGRVCYLRFSGNPNGSIVRPDYYFHVDELLRSDASFIIACSFHYDRFFEAEKLSGQDPQVYTQAEEFHKLFAHGYKEMMPTYRTIGFTNPTIRIVSLDEIRGAAGKGNEGTN